MGGEGVAVGRGGAGTGKDMEVELVNYQIWTQVRFRLDTKHGEYNDALYFSPEEFEKLETPNLEQQMQERADAWAAAVEEASKQIPPEPTREEMEAEIARLDESLARMTAEREEKLAALSAKIIDEPTVVIRGR